MTADSSNTTTTTITADPSVSMDLSKEKVLSSSSSSSPLSSFLNLSHLQQWIQLGPSPRGKPTNPAQMEAMAQRKQARLALKQKWKEELGGVTGTKILEKELDRLASLVWRQQQQQQPEDDVADLTIPEISRLLQQASIHPEDPPDYQVDPHHPANTMDHRPDGGPLLQYLWTKPPSSKFSSRVNNNNNSQNGFLQGQSLYLGGEVGSDGNIYCIPGHATRVLQINTTTHTMQLIGPELLTTGNGRWYKWLRGLVVGDIIYGLPCHADSILKINVKTQTITQLDIPYEETLYPKDPALAEQERKCPWKTHGGAICPLDGCIYAIPQSCRHVLKLDPTTETISIVGPSFPQGRCKWYGGIIGKSDGAIYGIPHNATGVLRITPHAVTVHGNFASEQHAWHGGAAAPNGVIVSVPANANQVLCITPPDTVDGEPKLDLIGDASFIQSGRHRDDAFYKYLGAMAGTNGKVYLFPCASEYVLQVDTVKMQAKNIGPNLRDTGMEPVHQNKWQNGLTCTFDQCVYGITLSGHTLLRIDCSSKNTNIGKHDDDDDDDDDEQSDPIVTTWQLPSPRIECRDKFEGGVYVPSTGVMYTVPNNHKGVLRIEPACLQLSP